ncbi:MAG TPA: gamma-glutamyltransferase family protein [Xanthobacteraceae bacterium]|jgi:gamma-glutamyltranspeptidase/glutathione hydrolase
MPAGPQCRSSRAPVFGREVMVVSGHAAATLAGIRILERGGNLVDAMVGASAALAVVVGQATSIGGDCFLLYHEAASGRSFGLNASGVAPALATPERFPDGMKTRGPLAPVVPGLVGAWDVMHRRFGRLPWKDLFDRAIELAQGHVVSKVLAERLPENRDALAADPGSAALYLPQGRPIRIGEVLRQPALAASLAAIAKEGADEFYLGDLARRIAQHQEERGGLIRAADLATYAPLWVEPIATDYRGHRVEVMPPNSYGILLLMQLNGLAALDSESLTRSVARRLGYQISAMHAAFEGVPSIADPGAIPDAIDRLLGPQATTAMRTAVLGGAGGPRIADRGGTSCLLLADQHGNAISLVQSVFNVFGSTMLDPGTGILFNNRMQGFTHKPGNPNSVGPGRRPAHTLCPVLVRRGGRLRFALATPGGLSQTLTNVQVLSYLVDEGRDVAAAVEAPRWCNTKTGDVLLDGEFSPSIVAELARMGHKAERAEDAYFYGSAKAIELLDTGTLAGGADYRREAFALGY